ncbi:DUF1203 domain-containing protein [Streptomyces hainanensis]|uniref:DUF1203 domain-containing protein n=1 Tax=Streptomyces hainanensis TaxID=402648 RepID=A0A4R4TDT1_9ACTN|nr:DUF1203 domain-containing protein [Streptomyces hainanensis]TDC75651.1 DUF1203 domain-containing protein [Streptomyces hainanensis]
MTTTSTPVFLIHALPAEALADVRERGIDAFGVPAERITATGGEPARCCLRDAAPGEEMLLFGYEPPLPAVSPYREVGAVFAHAEPCAGPGDVTRYPADWHGRAQVLRAYDAHGRIHDATTVHDGRDPERAIAEILATPGVVRIHSRNVAWGCYMFAVSAAVAGTNSAAASAVG